MRSLGTFFKREQKGVSFLFRGKEEKEEGKKSMVNGDHPRLPPSLPLFPVHKKLLEKIFPFLYYVHPPISSAWLRPTKGNSRSACELISPGEDIKKFFLFLQGIPSKTCFIMCKSFVL